MSPSALRPRPVLAGVAGLGLLGVLAGCSAALASDVGSVGGDVGGTSADSGGSGAPGPYKDGTYTADGSYLAPSGIETITVTLTLAGDKVTKVGIVGHATDPNAIQYQTMFASGISSVVVGKDVGSLGVSRVAGSSLTSAGFRAALRKIEKQAAGS